MYVYRIDFYQLHHYSIFLFRYIEIVNPYFIVLNSPRVHFLDKWFQNYYK